MFYNILPVPRFFALLSLVNILLTGLGGTDILCRTFATLIHPALSRTPILSIPNSPLPQINSTCDMKRASTRSGPTMLISWATLASHCLILRRPHFKIWCLRLLVRRAYFTSLAGKTVSFVHLARPERALTDCQRTHC